MRLTLNRVLQVLADRLNDISNDGETVETLKNEIVSVKRNPKSIVITFPSVVHRFFLRNNKIRLTETMI